MPTNFRLIIFVVPFPLSCYNVPEHIITLQLLLQLLCLSACLPTQMALMDSSSTIDWSYIHPPLLISLLFSSSELATNSALLNGSRWCKENDRKWTHRLSWCTQHITAVICAPFAHIVCCCSQQPSWAQFAAVVVSRLSWTHESLIRSNLSVQNNG